MQIATRINVETKSNMTRRIEKVNELLKEVIANIILREVQFPAGTMATLTRVSVSPDLHYADVFVTIFAGDREVQQEALLLLKKSTREIQRQLNRKLRMRPVPRILFLVDEEEKRRERIEELLAAPQKFYSSEANKFSSRTSQNSRKNLK